MVLRLSKVEEPTKWCRIRPRRMSLDFQLKPWPLWKNLPLRTIYYQVCFEASLMGLHSFKYRYYYILDQGDTRVGLFFWSLLQMSSAILRYCLMHVISFRSKYCCYHLNPFVWNHVSNRGPWGVYYVLLLYFIIKQGYTSAVFKNQTDAQGHAQGPVCPSSLSFCAAL